MQADEFEKKIQSKMEEFELLPGSEVWKQVSTRVNQEKKKRRVAFYWLFIGFALLAGTLSYWLINNENPKLVINELKNNVSKAENYKLKQSIPNSLQHLKKVQRFYKEKDRVHIKKDELKPVLRPETKNILQSKNIFTKGINRKRILLPQKKYDKVYKEDKKYTQRSLPPHKFYNPELAKSTAPVKNVNTNEKTDFRKDTSINTIIKENRAKKQANKKWNFGFTMYSGMSDNVPRIFSQKNPDRLANYSSAFPGNNGNYNYNVNAASNFKTGFSFGLGIFVKKHITKKISLSAGIDYHLYSVKSVVGNRVNQQVSFYDSYLQNSTLANGYYTIGDSNNYTITNSENYSNNYHLVQLPLNLGYQLNKNQEKPILISAGMTPGYLLATNALYANPPARVLYVDKEKFHRFQLSAQSSFLFPVSGSHKYTLSTGPMVQYGLTNATKAVTNSSQHLFFAGVKVNMTLK